MDERAVAIQSVRQQRASAKPSGSLKPCRRSQAAILRGVAPDGMVRTHVPKPGLDRPEPRAARPLDQSRDPLPSSNCSQLPELALPSAISLHADQAHPIRSGDRSDATWPNSVTALASSISTRDELAGQPLVAREDDDPVAVRPARQLDDAARRAFLAGRGLARPFDQHLDRRGR